MINTAVIYIKDGKTFLPTYNQIRGGPYFQTEPVLVSDLTEENLISTLDKLYKAGHPQFTLPYPSFLRDYKSPLLKIAGVRSWKQLCREGVAYTITWGKDDTKLHLHALDKKGRFDIDPTRTITFSKGATISQIVMAILADIKKLPTLGYINPTKN